MLSQSATSCLRAIRGGHHFTDGCPCSLAHTPQNMPSARLTTPACCIAHAVAGPSVWPARTARDEPGVSSSLHRAEERARRAEPLRRRRVARRERERDGWRERREREWRPVPLRSRRRRKQICGSDVHALAMRRYALGLADAPCCPALERTLSRPGPDQLSHR